MTSRIKALRELLNLNQSSFSESLGVNQGTVSGWENGNSVPEPMIRLICLTHNVRRDWLVNGLGEPFNNPVSNSVNSLNDKELTREYVRRVFERLPEKLQAVALEIANVLLEKNQNK